MMTEHELQNLIRLHISENKLGTMFRANVGSGWTGTVHKSSARSVTIYGARRFSTGLPAGFLIYLGSVQSLLPRIWSGRK